MPTLTTKFRFFDTEWKEYNCTLFITQNTTWAAIEDEHDRTTILLTLEQIKNLHAGLNSFLDFIQNNTEDAHSILKKFEI